MDIPCSPTETASYFVAFFFFFLEKSVQVTLVLCLLESRLGKKVRTKGSSLWTMVTKGKFGRYEKSAHEKCL